MNKKERKIQLNCPVFWTSLQIAHKYSELNVPPDLCKLKALLTSKNKKKTEKYALSWSFVNIVGSFLKQGTEHKYNTILKIINCADIKDEKKNKIKHFKYYYDRAFVQEWIHIQWPNLVRFLSNKISKRKKKEKLL